MCCCDTPNTNGKPGYKWQPGDRAQVRSVDPPEMKEGDSLIFDEPGRCGGMDSHCHHYRVVQRGGQTLLLVRNGAGDKSLSLTGATATGLLDGLRSLSSDARYWVLNSICHAYSAGARITREEVDTRWRQAAADKRIKTRKQRGRNTTKVWITPKVSA